MRRTSHWFLWTSLCCGLLLAACSGEGLSTRSLENRLEDALSFDNEEEQNTSIPESSVGPAVAEVDDALVPGEIRAEQRFVLLLMVKGPDARAVKYIRIAIEGLDGRHVRVPLPDRGRAPFSGAVILDTQLALDRKLFGQTFTLQVAVENEDGQLGPRYPISLHVGDGSCSAQTETCNLVDDNCDGQVDEGFSGLYNTCAAGTAACPVEGVLACLEDESGLGCFGDAGLAEGRTCDDGEDCTHSDTCDAAGDCGGTPLSCEDDPGGCGPLRTCNGTAVCTETYPDAGTDCEDGLFCTAGDACDGAGLCVSGQSGPCLVDGETCFEDEDRCCQDNVARTCDGLGDAYWMDSCGHMGALFEDCPPNSTCAAGVCACTVGWNGPGCDVAEDCADMPDFTKCDDGDPARAWDICVAGACVSPGCGFPSCNTPGAHFLVPDTNLRVCSDAQAEVACPDTASPYYGQDAQYGWDMNHQASERYTVSDPAGAGEIVVEDRITGLVWQQVSTIQTLPEGLAACDASTYAGFTDWHLPSAAELVTLVTADPTNPTIDQTAFPLTPASIFWTIEGTGVGTDEYWVVDFRLGGVQSANAYNQGYRGRCVRGGGLGALLETGRFTSSDPASADQFVVADSITGLTWVFDSALNPTGGGIWLDALAVCETTTWAGFTDWRLPNIQELVSLVDHRFAYPAMDPQVFGGMQEGSLWSSTAAKDNPTNAHMLDVQEGRTFLGAKNGFGATICVRGTSAP